MTTHLYDMAMSVPWLITSDALDAMLAITLRAPIEPAELARVMHGPRSLALRPDHIRDDSDRLIVRNGTGILRIDGPIYRYADMFTSFSGGVTTESIARDYQRALDDPAVSRILLVIDSPGGEATGINELADLIYDNRTTKETIAYIEGYGASAAYWIASACEQIVIDETALLGSIGTIMGVPDPDKRPSSVIEFVSSQSPNKRPDPRTDAGRAVIQTLVDDITEVFVENVMRNRGMTRDQVLAVHGGMLVGQHAIAAGLADELGSEESLLAGPAATQATRRGLMGFKTEVPKEQPASVPASVPISAELISAELIAPADPRIAELETRLAALQAESIARAAAHLADETIRSGKALPAEHGAIVALYTQLALDDTRQPQPSPRTAALETLLAGRETNDRTRERIPANAALIALMNDTNGQSTMLDTARKQGEDYARRANGKPR